MTREEAINVLEQLMGIQIGHFTDAEMLTALDMAVDALRWNPNWISVEDGLPEVDQVVWIFTDDGKAGIARYDKQGFNVSALLLQVNVTHWMEIQPPRKEANNEN